MGMIFGEKDFCIVFRFLEKKKTIQAERSKGTQPILWDWRGKKTFLLDNKKKQKDFEAHSKYRLSIENWLHFKMVQQ